jgi:hypothetical protein
VIGPHRHIHATAGTEKVSRLRTGQNAVTVRRDVDVRDVKAILSGCLAMLAAKPDAAELLTEVVLDGLRAG